ncbi:hypothetical protein PVK06_010531 [Gossypium arboreum]|uniref:Uncharacterized protein n=1 Tax=Gossypium arboreum TaxID=29729 RepID=A0ABR0Q6I2_GOSAR|nr:hypothetical protein PVK06_010531 [Gossypium arboreum]
MSASVEREVVFSDYHHHHHHLWRKPMHFSSFEDLSTPLVPKEKLPPPQNSRLPEARNGDGFCGAAMLGWVPNGTEPAAGGFDAPKTNPETEGVDPNTKPGIVLPNTGCDGVAAAAEMNENMELEEAPVDEPKRVDAPLGALKEVDDPKENPDDERNVGVLGACQVEPNAPPAMPLLELRDLVSEEEELIPKLEPELKDVPPKMTLPVLVAADVPPNKPVAVLVVADVPPKIPLPVLVPADVPPKIPLLVLVTGENVLLKKPLPEFVTVEDIPLELLFPEFATSAVVSAELLAALLPPKILLPEPMRFDGETRPTEINSIELHFNSVTGILLLSIPSMAGDFI